MLFRSPSISARAHLLRGFAHERLVDRLQSGHAGHELFNHQLDLWRQRLALGLTLDPLPLHVRDDRAGSGVMTSGRHWRSPAGLDSTPSTETTSPTTVAETRRLPTLSPSILAR